MEAAPACREWRRRSGSLKLLLLADLGERRFLRPFSPPVFPSLSPYLPSLSLPQVGTAAGPAPQFVTLSLSLPSLPPSLSPSLRWELLPDPPRSL